MYTQINISAFKGLNSTTAPELIDDGEARDILNFRMEKVGKLVSRNGYICGLFAVDHSLATHISSMSSDAYVANGGIIGIGEMVLTEKWDEFDTDRFMVYVVRGVELDNLSLNMKSDFLSGNPIPQTEDAQNDTSRGVFIKRNVETYMFSPLTGKYTNLLVADYNLDYGLPGIDVNSFRDATPQGRAHSVPLFAPNRWKPGTSNTEDTNDDWIDHYIDMNQYRGKMVISDRINGDMILEDEFDRADLNVCENPEHELHLRPNCLESFDIDMVEITPRFSDENSTVNGVETGMALYKFELPKRVRKLTIDNYTRKLSDLNFVAGTENVDEMTEADRLDALEKLVATAREMTTSFVQIYAYYYHIGDDTSVNPLPPYQTYFNWARAHMFSFRQLGVDGSFVDIPARCLDGVDPAAGSIADDSAIGHGPVVLEIKVDLNQTFRFTNADQATEFYDILGEMKFTEDEYIDEDGKTVKEVAPDVYVWDDYKIKYYPCSGDSIYLDENGNVSSFSRYLKDIDRLFQKLIPNVGRLTKLNAKDNAGKKVPLGVWKYRFVWDFGDGTFSAPSAEVVVPDIMWSATKDEDMSNSFADYPGRPFDLNPDRFKQQPRLVDAKYDGYPGYYSSAGKSVLSIEIFDSNGNLTSLGKSIWAVKNKLYAQEFKYGPQFSTNDFSTATELQRGRFAAMATAFFGESAVPMKGTIWEGAGVAAGLYDWAAGSAPTMNMPSQSMLSGTYVVVGMGSLVIPVFQDGRGITYNSLFSDEGKYRRVFDCPIGGWAHQLVFPGHNYGVGQNTATIHDPRQHGEVCGGSWWIFTPEANNTTPIYPYSDLLFGDYTGKTENGIYYNLVRVEDDLNNKPSADLELQRTHTIFRAIKGEEDRLTQVTGSDIPSDALTRLVMSGEVEIEVIKPGEYVFFETEKEKRSKLPARDSIAEVEEGTWDYMEREVGTDEDERYAIRQMGSIENKWVVEAVRLANSGGGTWNNTGNGYYEAGPADGANIDDGFMNVNVETSNDIYGSATNGVISFYGNSNNISAYLYGTGERLTAVEQLTSVFPSSLLFNAPRLGIKIHRDEIPARAKKLLIFRTLCTHANNYEPTSFGLVEEVDLRRYTIGDVASLGTILSLEGQLHDGDVFTEMDNGSYISSLTGETFYDGFYYFDDVKDSNLDFSRIPIDFEGLRKPLKSRFNLPLNERMFYFNFIEEYQPMAPRKNENDVPTVHDEVLDMQTADLEVMDSEDSDGYTSLTYVRYLYVYEDLSGVLSLDKRANMLTPLSITVPLGSKPKVVVLYLMPSKYDESVKKLKVYRAKKEGADWEAGIDTPVYHYIGDVEAGDEGIFVDTNLPDGGKIECLKPAIYTYESGMMESQPFRPDWIKPDKFYEYRSGDGRMITGADSIYGDMMVYKEMSIHRVTVQGEDPAVSRTDEVSPNIGCIAPNTLINVDGTHYFLSWKGFMKYDNNQLQKIDGAFDEELQYILNTVPKEYIRDASCGYNSAFNEIYLNIPMLRTTDLYTRQRDFGHGKMYQSNLDNENPDYYERVILGHIYIINLEKGYATKFAYPGTLEDLNYLLGTSQVPTEFVKDVHSPIQMIRLYYNNTQGEMRSADILPSKWNQSVSMSPEAPGLWGAGMWIETPYNLNLSVYMLDDLWWNLRKIALGGVPTLTQDEQVVLTDYDDLFDGRRLNGWGRIFPPLVRWPVRSEFRSKFFTGTIESVIKRIRKTVVNIFSRGGTTLKNVVVPRDNETTPGDYSDFPVGDRADERIEQKPHEETTSIYGYSSSVDSTTDFAGFTIAQNGLGTNLISCIPRSPELGVDNDDWGGKPIRYSLEIQSTLRTQINAIEIYWRPIHTYLS